MIINHQAIRAFNRVWAPHAEAFAMAADLDAGFDGGEWSRGINDRMEAREFADCLQRVARRFDLSAQQLEEMIQQADYESQVSLQLAGINARQLELQREWPAASAARQAAIEEEMRAIEKKFLAACK
jgi:hypothetical protein